LKSIILLEEVAPLGRDGKTTDVESWKRQAIEHGIAGVKSEKIDEKRETEGKGYQEIMELHTCRAKRKVKMKGIERRLMLTRAHGIASPLHCRGVDPDQGGTENIIFRPVQDLKCLTLKNIKKFVEYVRAEMWMGG
jgi:hypothetical protein